MMTDLRYAVTFIGGHPKSGTSLIMTLLDSHPQLIVYPEETGFFRRFAWQTADVPLEDQFYFAEELLFHIFQWNAKTPHPSQEKFLDRDYSDVSYEEVKKLYYQNIRAFGKTHSDILTAVVLAFGEASGQLTSDTKRWVEKTPHNEYHADKIFAWWPEARCIHIVRDPRDNYASYRRKHPEWGPEYFAFSWRNSIHCGWKNQKLYGKQRYLIIRYEDLVIDLEETISAVRRFLDIKDDPILREPTRNGQPWGGNSMFGERFNGVSERPLGRYRQVLAPGIVRRLEAALFPEMRRLDYQIEGPISPLTRFVWLAYRTRRKLFDEVRKYRHKTHYPTQVIEA
jgi:hypothetical protein